MGTGYTRNDTPNNIADGNVINASDLDGEFDAIQSAFNGSTGHSHDGTTGEGPQIATAGLADNAVTTAKITDANVTLAKMAANSVDSDQYVDGSIDRVHLAADIVDGTKIADDSIDSEHYVDGSIDTAHIANDAVTGDKLANNIQIAGTLGVTGETTLTTHLNMGDNDIIKLGASADLQIYHDGTDSIIKESGGGDLQIWGDDIRLMSADGTETMLRGNPDAQIQFYYDNAVKLATTSTGIDVTGTATMDGLTVDGDVTINSASPEIYLMESDTTDVNTRIRTSVGDFRIETINDAKNSIVLRQSIDHATGDINLGYEDTGTTPKLFWDASEERLGIGDTTPSYNLDVVGDARVTSGFIANGGVVFNENSNDVDFRVESNTGTHALFVQGSDGNVGIGTSSPSKDLHIASTGPQIRLQDTNNASGNVGLTGTVSFYDSAEVIAGYVGYGSGSHNDFYVYNAENSNIVLYTNGTEAMRIDSSQNLLVGTTTEPSSLITATSGGGHALTPNYVAFTRQSTDASFPVVVINETGVDGVLTEFRKDGSTVGSIGADSGDLTIGTGDTGFRFRDAGDDILPFNMSTGVDRDDAIDLGDGGARFDDIYATNGTIQTSDQQEKNTITDSDLGIDFIKRLTPKSYIFNGKTRTHYGLIAQDVETVLTDISKPTSGFAGFIKSDISEEQDGSEYRYGLRYGEFIAPLIQAVKDQQATIDALTARITALENGE